MIIYRANDGIVRSDPRVVPDEVLPPTEPITLDVLASKECLLIDVWKTFLMPGTGMPEFDGKPIVLRDGFLEFLEHYKGAGKRIGIHTDAFVSKGLSAFAKVWGIDSFVDKYFAKEYSFWKDPDTGARIETMMAGGYKHFKKMVKELGVDPSKTLVIGDGASEEGAAIYADIDLLLVPPYIPGDTFSFRDLI